MCVKALCLCRTVFWGGDAGRAASEWGRVRHFGLWKVRELLRVSCSPNTIGMTRTEPIHRMFPAESILALSHGSQRQSDTE